MSKSTQIQGKGFALFLNGDIVKRAQGLEFGADLSVENIQELANANFVEKKSDTPKVSISFETNDIGSMALLKLLESGVQLPSAGGYAVSRDSNGVYYPTYSGNEVVRMADPNYDLDHQLCPSFIVKVSEHNDTTLDRSCHMQGAYLDSIEFNYDVGGLAKENFRFSTDHKAWYFDGAVDNRDIDLDFPAYASAVTATTTADATGKTVKAIYVNRECVYNVEQSIDTCGFTSWVGTTLTVANNTFATGDRIEVVFIHNTPRSFPKLNTTNTGSCGGRRRGAVLIYANKSGDSAVRQLRVQSVSGSLDMGRTEINELGTQRYIDKPVTYPLNVRFDMTFNASDLEAIATFQGNKGTYGTTLDEIDVKNMIDNCEVKVEIYSDEYDHSASKLAKTILLQHCKVVSEGDSARIGNSAGQWRATVQADAITWSGSGLAID